MKLATYRDGSRDGQLVVVSRDLSRAHYTSHIASRMQQVLDDWAFYAPQLAALSDALNAGQAAHAFAFDAAQCLAPLPRPVQMLQAQCYEYPEDFEYAHCFDVNQPRLKSPVFALGVLGDLGAKRGFLGPRLRSLNSAAVHGPRFALAAEAWAQGLGIDEKSFENIGLDVCANLAVICAGEAAEPVPRLFTLAAQLHLSGLENSDENQSSAYHFHATPATVFAPVALTADELGPALDAHWRLHLPLRYTVNARKIGLCDAGIDQRWPWGATLAHAARLEALAAGAVVLSGEIHQIQKIKLENQANSQENLSENPTENSLENSQETHEENPKWHFPQGHASLRTRRLAEQLRRQPKKMPENPTELLKIGDHVDIQMSDRAGRDLFGHIHIQIE